MTPNQITDSINRLLYQSTMVTRLVSENTEMAELLCLIIFSHREKLSRTGTSWWARAIIVNVFTAIFLFLFTTPTIILNSLNKINYKDHLQLTNVSQRMSPLLICCISFGIVIDSEIMCERSYDILSAVHAYDVLDQDPWP